MKKTFAVLGVVALLISGVSSASAAGGKCHQIGKGGFHCGR